MPSALCCCGLRPLDQLENNPSHFVGIQVGEPGAVRTGKSLGYGQPGLLSFLFSLFEALYQKPDVVEALALLPEKGLVDGFSVLELDQLHLDRAQVEKSPFPPVAGRLSVVRGGGIIHVSDFKGAESEDLLVILDCFVDALDHDADLAEARGGEDLISRWGVVLAHPESSFLPYRG